MPDQEKREKVIEHITDCIKIADRQFNNWVFVRTDILRDALALLKAQEPQVLSLEEARDFFVIEYHYSGKIRKVGDELTADDDCRDYYNRVWRIWDHMPTDEERRAAPWN